MPAIIDESIDVFRGTESTADPDANLTMSVRQRR